LTSVQFHNAEKRGWNATSNLNWFYLIPGKSFANVQHHRELKISCQFEKEETFHEGRRVVAEKFSSLEKLRHFQQDKVFWVGREHLKERGQTEEESCLCRRTSNLSFIK
jgi:hypothetical protein